jgi:hypothetical protein
MPSLNVKSFMWWRLILQSIPKNYIFFSLRNKPGALPQIVIYFWFSKFSVVTPLPTDVEEFSGLW